MHFDFRVIIAYVLFFVAYVMHLSGNPDSNHTFAMSIFMMCAAIYHKGKT